MRTVVKLWPFRLAKPWQNARPNTIKSRQLWADDLLARYPRPRIQHKRPPHFRSNKMRNFTATAVTLLLSWTLILNTAITGQAQTVPSFTQEPIHLHEQLRTIARLVNIQKLCNMPTYYLQNQPIVPAAKSCIKDVRHDTYPTKRKLNNKALMHFWS